MDDWLSSKQLMATSAILLRFSDVNAMSRILALANRVHGYLYLRSFVSVGLVGLAFGNISGKPQWNSRSWSGIWVNPSKRAIRCTDECCVNMSYLHQDTQMVTASSPKHVESLKKSRVNKYTTNFEFVCAEASIISIYIC